MNERKPLLVVDDEEYNRDLLRRRLERAGYAVEVAASGQSALELIERRQFELVLLLSLIHISEPTRPY